MPRSVKPLVIETIGEPARAQQLPPANLDQPDMVACIRCGESSPSAATKCPGCALRFDDDQQHSRALRAYNQTMAAGERAQREHVAKSRAGDPNLASSVTAAHELVIRDIERERDAAAAEVEASKERFEKACAVVFAVGDDESRKARDAAHAEMTAAPTMLELWDSALARAQSLRSLAGESDALVAAGPSARDFQTELANRMAAARKHFAAAFAEVAGAFEAQSRHAGAMRAGSSKRKELNEQLASIKRSLSLNPKLQQGFGRFASHEDVSFAAVQIIIETLSASGIQPALVDDLRARVRSQ